MFIKAIIASLVLGSSSIAMASPSVTFSATVQGAHGTTVVRDHRIDVNFHTRSRSRSSRPPTTATAGAATGCRRCTAR
jgi:hypothetical protein